MAIYIAFLLLLFLHFSPMKSQLHVQHHSMHDNTTDQLALLSFKSHITHDPFGVLSSWSTNTTFCNWHGITCNITRQRVTHLIIEDQNLKGTLSPYITNLTFLRFISLNNNSFHGPLPSDIGRLFRLRNLAIGYNHISGRLPSSLSLCTELRFLNVIYNECEGNIPSDLGALGNLQFLVLGFNNFIGRIPPSLGNLTSLIHLGISGRGLYGPIPRELGRLQKLAKLGVGMTNLDGEIPPSLFNISSLSDVEYFENRFSGGLPSDMFSTLPNLVVLNIHSNHLSGPIPSSIANASNLKLLDMSINSFSGRIPLLSDMRNIQKIILERNELGSDSNNDMDFISSLANANQLQVLVLDSNNLRGRIPSSVGNLSKELSYLFLGENQLEGSLPTTVANLVGLAAFGVEHNLFSGNIPPSLGQMPTLLRLNLGFNRFSGSIPESLGNLSQLYDIYLDHNNFTGVIPTSLSRAQKLQAINLSNNMLTGTIPKEIFSLPDLIYFLDLHANSLSGPIPIEIGKLTMIEGLYFSDNHLTEEIPPSIGDCVSLRYLDLSRNSLRGPIPKSLSNLKSIEEIELSSNNISGEIPSALQYLMFIELLNLSMNHLEGEVPKDGVFKNSTAISLFGNPYLCGGVSTLALPKCKIHDRHSGGLNMKLMLGIVVSCVGLAILSCSIIFIIWRQNRRKPQTNEVISFEGQHQLYTYHDLRIATNNFSVDNLIGQGSFGRVYKGILSDEMLVAIKVFNMNHDKFLKSFYHECGALRSVRHRNLVKIISACSSSEFKALVLEFMPNGSLEQWLSRPVSEFNTVQKLKVAANVAAGMEYLHHDCETPVVHCDLKPSNILLDEDMIAHVADFGLARMLLENPEGPLSSTLGLKGSIGYIAPEYGMFGDASRKGDVYSYGILLLEMFTGKKPTDEMFIGELDLQKWVADIVDNELVQDDEGVILASVLKIGLACASMSPEDRPTMRDVSSMISSAKK